MSRLRRRERGRSNRSRQPGTGAAGQVTTAAGSEFTQPGDIVVVVNALHDDIGRDSHRGGGPDEVLGIGDHEQPAFCPAKTRHGCCHAGQCAVDSLGVVEAPAGALHGLHRRLQAYAIGGRGQHQMPLVGNRYEACVHVRWERAYVCQSCRAREVEPPAGAVVVEQDHHGAGRGRGPRACRAIGGRWQRQQGSRARQHRAHARYRPANRPGAGAGRCGGGDPSAAGPHPGHHSNSPAKIPGGTWIPRSARWLRNIGRRPVLRSVPW